MSDGEDGNALNLHLSQNGQDGKVVGQSDSKDQNEKKRKTLLMRVFQVSRTTLQVREI